MSDTFNRSVSLRDAAHMQSARRRFDTLCSPHRADLYRFVFWLCRDRSLTEDVLQETLLRAWQSIETLENPGSVRSWLLTIARRELARTFERKRLPTVDLASIDEIEAAHPGESHEVHDMRRAIAALDEIYREPLVLQVLLGMSTDEIAEQLGISTAAVLTRLFRARNLLRERLLGTGVQQEGGS